MIQNEDRSEDEMEEAVSLRQRRHAEWQRTGERPPWRNLSLIGAIGWLIVVPVLLGVLLGRWLDAYFGSGIFWSGALIILGAAVGSYLAWQRVTEE